MAKRKRKKRKQDLRHKVLKITLQTGLAIFAAMGLFVASVYLGVFGKLPNKEALADIKNNQATEVYTADGKTIGRFFLQQRSSVPYQKISPHVIKSLVATEDARFYEHNGVDYRSLFRVFFRTFLLQDRSGGGGSTISQQLAKNLYQRDRSTFIHLGASKVKEMIIASRLEEVYSKEEILAMYLNTVPFGENIYGIETASKRFFNKSASALKLEEAAVLVGMLKANHTYNPRLFPENATNRRNTVLAQLNKYDYLSKDSMEYLQSKRLKINYTRIDDESKPAAYYHEQIRKKIMAWCQANTKPDGSNYNVYTDGLKIHTTLDSRLQTYAEEAMQSHMKELQSVFEKHWGSQKPWYEHPEILEQAVRQAADNRPDSTLDQKYPMEVFTWDGETEKEMTALDSVAYYLKFLQAGLVSLDPQTGAIKAWVGGINYKYFKYDHVKKSTKRQVGSTFKPFVYAAALQKGIEPCYYISARKVRYANLDDWAPSNADNDEDVLKYSLTGALSHSVNTVTIKLIEEVGIENAVSLAHHAGIDSDLPKVPSVALGTASISVLEMATAYSIFANNGLKISPYTITKITNRSGEVLYEYEPPKEQERVLSQEISQLMAAMLKQTVNAGTATRIRWKYNLKNDIAGKTGTTQSNADGWFIGFNPALVTAVWVGADNPGIRFRSTALGSGANMALPIFAKMYQKINADRELKVLSTSRFEPLPARLSSKLDCDPSKDARNFVQKLFNTDISDKEKVRKFDDNSKKENKGLFKRIGDLFKKKDG